MSAAAKHRLAVGGWKSDNVFVAAYVIDYIQIGMQHGIREDVTAVDVSASLASNHLSLFIRPGSEGEAPILAPKKTTNWNVELEGLGCKRNTGLTVVAVREIGSDSSIAR